jgi:glycosyltransferase involved in cell wall biosynthesis
LNPPRRSEVVIVQRRLTHYRVPLFEKLRAALEADGVRLRLLHGAPTAEDATKRDEGRLDWAEALPATDLLGGRLCWQPYGAPTASADLVIVTQENRFLYNLWALSAGRARGRPRRVAFWGHGANLQSRNPDGWRERFKRVWTRRVDWWFAYTALSVELVRRDGFAPERITNVENAIDTRALAADCGAVTGAELEAARRRLGLQGARVGLFMGSLYEPKRLPFLLEAGAQLAARVPGFTLLVSGDGPQRGLVAEAARTRPWLRQLGMQKGRDKAIALRLSEVILNPGLVGLGILDAFTAGLPLVTTDCRIHSPEIAYLRSGENGLMTPNTLAAYVEGAVALLGNEAERRRLGVNAQSAAARYTIENMAQRFRTGIHGALRVAR